MLGRSLGPTAGIFSNRSAVPVRLLSQASPPPRPSPFEGEGALRSALGQYASRIRGGGSGWGSLREQPTARWAKDGSPTRSRPPPPPPPPLHRRQLPPL